MNKSLFLNLHVQSKMYLFASVASAVAEESGSSVIGLGNAVSLTSIVHRGQVS